MKLKKKKKNFFFFFFFFFEKKSPESAPKFSGRSGNRKHNYFFWPYGNTKLHISESPDYKLCCVNSSSETVSNNDRTSNRLS